MVLGAFGLAKQLNISQGEAKAYIDAFFSTLSRNC